MGEWISDSNLAVSPTRRFADSVIRIRLSRF
jgi:hypothetical protein